MTKLVSLEQASMHLRRDTTDDDPDLELKIEAASAAVLNYLKDGADFLNSDEDVDQYSDVPREVQLATLYLIGLFYRDRDGQEAKEWQAGYLPAPVTALLYPLRKPAMA